MSTKLINPTDDELNAAFGEHVAKWTKPAAEGPLADFTEYSDSILPYLENGGWSWAHETSYMDNGRAMRAFGTVTVYGPKDKTQIGRHDYFKDECSFSKASVIAMLRANGIEVEFTFPEQMIENVALLGLSCDPRRRPKLMFGKEKTA